jgi:SAM-dependent methyltransferase
MSSRPACPICGSGELVEFAGRADARCAVCDALERHRALAREMRVLLREGDGRQALEAGPASTQVFGGFLRERGWRYLSIDQSRSGHPDDPRDVGFIDHEADLCDLSLLDNGAIDLVIAQHVIEEIPAFEMALSEIARVLSPHGTALLEIPYDPRLERSQRHPPGRYGNVWRFGADLPGVVRRHFASAQPVPLQEGAYMGRVLVCGHGR